MVKFQWGGVQCYEENSDLSIRVITITKYIIKCMVNRRRLLEITCIDSFQALSTSGPITKEFERIYAL